MRITDNNTAKQWLDDHGIRYVLNDDEEVVLETICWRCGGTGYWSRGHWNQGGICFKCQGTGGKSKKYIPVKAYAQQQKAKVAQRERAQAEAERKEARRHEAMLEGQRRWCEEHGYGRITFEEREAQKEAERVRKQAKQQYVGEVKQRLEFEATYANHYGYDTQWGYVSIYRFVDDAGNVFIWKTNTALCDEEGYFFNKGTRVRIKGTVKEHKEYRGDKQTVLTRCKVAATEKCAPKPTSPLAPEPKPEPTEKPEIKKAPKTAREKYEQMFA